MNQELRNKLIEWSKSRDDIDLVVVFGSRAHERNRPDSDLDLAIWRSCAWTTDFVRECMDELTDYSTNCYVVDRFMNLFLLILLVDELFTHIH